MKKTNELDPRLDQIVEYADKVCAQIDTEVGAPYAVIIQVGQESDEQSYNRNSCMHGDPLIILQLLYISIRAMIDACKGDEVRARLKSVLISEIKEM